MANWIDDAPYVKVACANNDWTEILVAEPQRRLLSIRNNSGVTIFVAYQNADPDPDITGDPGDRMPNGDKIYWDASLMPTTSVWVFQNSGAPVDVHIASAL